VGGDKWCETAVATIDNPSGCSNPDSNGARSCEEVAITDDEDALLCTLQWK